MSNMSKVTQTNSKAILVIDMIKGFTEKGSLYDPNIQRIVKPIANFLKINQNEDIYFICDAHSESDLEMQNYPLHCLKGTNESEIDDQLAKFAKPNKIYFKDTTNGFHHFPVEILKKYKEIVFVGCCTDICVLQFVLSLKTYFNKEKIQTQIVVYENLVDTFNSETHNRDLMHEFALRLMENAGVKIKR